MTVGQSDKGSSRTDSPKQCLRKCCLEIDPGLQRLVLASDSRHVRVERDEPFRRGGHEMRDQATCSAVAHE